MSAEDRVVALVAEALRAELPLSDPSGAQRLASVAVDAMLPEGSVLTEQCAIRFAGPDLGLARDEVSLVGDCELAERLAETGPDTHVHRFLLTTPWQAQPGRRRPSPRRSEGA